MSARILTGLSIFAVASLAAVLSVGCALTIGFDMPGEFARTVETAAALPAGENLSAATHNGYVNVTGADVAECSLKAAIRARAADDETAEQLTAATAVELVHEAAGMRVKIDKPRLERNQSIAVDLDITVPRKTALALSTYNGAVTVLGVDAAADCTSHNGRIECGDIGGDLKAKTYNGRIICRNTGGEAVLESHNGGITCEDVSGDVQIKGYNGRISCVRPGGDVSVECHNGGVVCEGVVGDVRVKTYNARVRAAYAETAAAAPEINITTHNGGISLTAPRNFSAKVDMSTHNGSIKSDLPIVLETFKKYHLTGVVGDGEGTLDLKTYNGSIKID